MFRISIYSQYFANLDLCASFKVITSEKNSFLGLCSNQYWSDRVYDLCILWLGHPKAQPKEVLEKQGIKPVTSGLQGIALIHYTMEVITSDAW